MRYSQDLIDRVREATDIVPLVGEQLRLTKAGRSFKGLCPFHAEKTPSFHVNPDRQIYHCFGCGAGGNAITFLIEHAKLTFPEAIRTLAERAGIALPARTDDAAADIEISRIHEALSLAAEFFEERLAHRDVGRPARDYLAGRDISMETATTFGLGFAPAGWSNFLDVAVKKFTPDILAKAGLIVLKDDGGAYDRFRNRLMVPIASASGRVIGFGGRTMGDDDAKYINSPESPVYQKGQLLFGLAMARDAMRSSEEAILVEGYFDHLRAVAAGFPNVVAVAGTAFTPNQAALLRRHAARVHLVFDGDSAGLNAAWKAAGLCLAAGLLPLLVILPEGDDPDSLIRRDGPAAFRAALDSSLDLIGFTKARLVPKLGKEDALKRLVDQIRESPDPIRRRLMIQEAADRLRFDEATLVRAVEQRRPIGPARSAESGSSLADGQGGSSGRAPASAAELPVVERTLLAILLDQPTLLGGLGELDADDFDDERSRELFRQLPTLDGSTEALHRLMDAGRGTGWGRVLSQLAFEPTHDGADAAHDCARRLREKRLTRLITELKIDLADAERSGDSERAARIFRQINELSNQRLSLSTGAMTKP
ncbi:MAG: DNA primase [Candidatus Eisenbacteria bacterium]|nr:DNA primase [Candidatus Eisenbacteria bacterium]